MCAAVVLVRDTLPVPVQQGPGRRNRGYLRQQPSSEQFPLCCQATALIVSEAKAAVVEPSPKHPVLFAQILDGVLLMLIHPAGDRYQQKANGSSVFCIVSEGYHPGLGLVWLRRFFSCRSRFRILRHWPHRAGERNLSRQ
jgi:hypothetical protein